MDSCFSKLHCKRCVPAPRHDDHRSFFNDYSSTRSPPNPLRACHRALNRRSSPRKSSPTPALICCGAMCHSTCALSSYFCAVGPSFSRESPSADVSFTLHALNRLQVPCSPHDLRKRGRIHRRDARVAAVTDPLCHRSKSKSSCSSWAFVPSCSGWAGRSLPSCLPFPCLF